MTIRHLALCAALGAVAVGCGQAVPPPDQGGPNGDLDRSTREELFVELIHDEFPETEGVPDATLIDAAQATCDALDDGASMTDVALEIATSGAPADLSGYIMGAGISAFCPEYQDELDAFTSRFG